MCPSEHGLSAKDLFLSKKKTRGNSYCRLSIPSFMSLMAGPICMMVKCGFLATRRATRTCLNVGAPGRTAETG